MSKLSVRIHDSAGFLLRIIVRMAVHIVYRIRVSGSRNIPQRGAALLIPNHVSWADALILIAVCRRRIRFVMERSIYDTPFFNRIFRFKGVIPVSASDDKKQLLEFVRRSRQVIEDGDLLCIFAEGSITRDGQVQEFMAGFERVVKGRDCPIIPVYLDGLWGSILSYAHGRLLSKFPSFFRRTVSVLIGEAMPAESSAKELRQAVMALSIMQPCEIGKKLSTTGNDSKGLSVDAVP